LLANFAKHTTLPDELPITASRKICFETIGYEPIWLALEHFLQALSDSLVNEPLHIRFSYYTLKCLMKEITKNSTGGTTPYAHG
jgi:hypothetical protein